MLPDPKAKAKPRAATPTAPAPVAAPIRHRRASRHAAAAAPAAPVPRAANPWKRLVLAGVAVVAIIGVGFGGIQVVGAIGGGQPTAGDNVAQAPQATQAAPAVDEAKVGALMEKLAADPKDTVTLMALADEYYAGQQFAQAGDFLDKLLAIEPENVQALLARGAVSFNLAKLDEAETTWAKVVVIDPKNVEAHYDLGFLYLNSATPDWAGVQREWNMVIELDPTSDLAKTVKSHLDSLAAASMIPGGSPAASGAAPGASAAPSPGASAAPGTSPAASPAASASPAPSASPAASTTP
jgi:tetratricopeptide (TPR) repeat protein